MNNVPRALFSVGEEVIVCWLDSKPTIHVISEINLDGKFGYGYHFCNTRFYKNRSCWWACENIIRKKPTPSTDSFQQIMADLTNPSYVAQPVKDNS